MAEPVSLTPKEAAFLCRVHPKTFLRWIREGLVDVERPTKRIIRIAPSALEKLKRRIPVRS